MPQGPRRKLFAKYQEVARKDGEQAFWCAQISIRNYMLSISCLEHRYNEGYNVDMHYIA